MLTWIPDIFFLFCCLLFYMLLLLCCILRFFFFAFAFVVVVVILLCFFFSYKILFYFIFSFLISTLKIEINEEQFLSNKQLSIVLVSQSTSCYNNNITANNCRSCNLIFYPFYFAASNSHCFHNVAYALLQLR